MESRWIPRNAGTGRGRTYRVIFAVSKPATANSTIATSAPSLLSCLSVRPACMCLFYGKLKMGGVKLNGARVVAFTVDSHLGCATVVKQVLLRKILDRTRYSTCTYSDDWVKVEHDIFFLNCVYLKAALKPGLLATACIQFSFLVHVLRVVLVCIVKFFFNKNLMISSHHFALISRLLLNTNR